MSKILIDEATVKLALEALEQLDGIDTETECVTIDVGDVITSLREALAEQPAPPPECQTEAEKTAYAFGWFKALEYVRNQPAQQEPVTSKTPLIDALNFFTVEERMELWKKHNSSDSQIAVITQAVLAKRYTSTPPAPVTDTELINRGCHYQTELTQPAPVQGWTDKKQTTLNEWFFSLPEQKQMFLIEDKWALAGAAFDAGMLAAAQQQEPVAGIDPKYLMTHISELVLKLPHGIKENT